MLVPEYAGCIEACHACAAACNVCAAACLREEDVAMMATCIETDLDCAQICWLTALLMERNSPHAKELCRICVEVCDLCADICAAHEHDHCQECASACCRCADQCRTVLAA